MCGREDAELTIARSAPMSGSKDAMTMPTNGGISA
jgi:hypothetical protein